MMLFYGILLPSFSPFIVSDKCNVLVGYFHTNIKAI